MICRRFFAKKNLMAAPLAQIVKSHLSLVAKPAGPPAASPLQKPSSKGLRSRLSTMATRSTCLVLVAFLLVLAISASKVIRSCLRSTCARTRCDPRSSPALQLTSSALEPKIGNVLLPHGWSGRIWGRTLCPGYATGEFTCATGDCDTGRQDCAGGGGPAPPATVVEFTMDGKGGRGRVQPADACVAARRLPCVWVRGGPQRRVPGRPAGDVGRRRRGVQCVGGLAVLQEGVPGGPKAAAPTMPLAAPAKTTATPSPSALPKTSTTRC
ncbi:hypothetical protein ACP70R_011383 [Stipagrostis hirtigluma subsp. patula]